MRLTLRHALLCVTTAAVVTGGSVLAASPAPAEVLGCPPGWACIFPTDQGIVPPPDYSWYHYGTYDIHNEYGLKDFCNQQTGGAVFRLYSQYGGKGTLIKTIPGSKYPGVGNCVRLSATPVYSVTLSTH